MPLGDVLGLEVGGTLRWMCWGGGYPQRDVLGGCGCLQGMCWGWGGRYPQGMCMWGVDTPRGIFWGSGHPQKMCCAL